MKGLWLEGENCEPGIFQNNQVNEKKWKKMKNTLTKGSVDQLYDCHCSYENYDVICSTICIISVCIKL